MHGFHTRHSNSSQLRVHVAPQHKNTIPHEIDFALGAGLSKEIPATGGIALRIVSASWCTRVRSRLVVEPLLTTNQTNEGDGRSQITHTHTHTHNLLSACTYALDAATA